MEPELVEVRPFTVSGISVRTVNRDEADLATAKLPGLWGRFHSEGVAGKVPGRSSDPNVYGVYSAYESDKTGAYTVTAGVPVSETPPEFDSVEVAGGRYLVFRAQGPIPRCVIEAWGRVWSYFESSKEHRRMFTTDFEAYSGPEEVTVHVAVE